MVKSHHPNLAESNIHVLDKAFFKLFHKKKPRGTLKKLPRKPGVMATRRGTISEKDHLNDLVSNMVKTDEEISMNLDAGLQELNPMRHCFKIMERQYN